MSGVPEGGVVGKAIAAPAPAAPGPALALELESPLDGMLTQGGKDEVLAAAPAGAIVAPRLPDCDKTHTTRLKSTITNTGLIFKPKTLYGKENYTLNLCEPIAHINDIVDIYFIYEISIFPLVERMLDQYGPSYHSVHTVNYLNNTATQIYI